MRNTTDAVALLLLTTSTLAFSFNNDFLSAFHRTCKSTIKPYNSISHSYSSSCLRTTLDDLGENGGVSTPEGDIVPPYPVMVASVELWLDLRGTAIVPRTALSHLADDQWGSFSPPPGKARLVDRVLVSEDRLTQSLQYIDHDMDIYYLKDADHTLRDARDEDVVLGGHIVLLEDVVTDPLPALDTVTGGDWIVVDSDRIQDEFKKKESITSLVNFLSAGSSTTAELLIEVEKVLLCDSDNLSKKGGIALSCNSKADLVYLCGLVRSISSEVSYAKTKSGILVQHHKEGAKREPKSNKSAIIIPFDADLWMAASFMIGEFMN